MIYVLHTIKTHNFILDCNNIYHEPWYLWLFVYTALDLKTPAVYEGTPKNGKADTTLTVSDADMVAIAAGSLSPQAAYMKGKLKIAGNLMLAQKLGPLLKSPAKI